MKNFREELEKIRELEDKKMINKNTVKLVEKKLGSHFFKRKNYQEISDHLDLIFRNINEYGLTNLMLRDSFFEIPDFCAKFIANIHHISFTTMPLSMCLRNVQSHFKESIFNETLYSTLEKVEFNALSFLVNYSDNQEVIKEVLTYGLEKWNDGEKLNELVYYAMNNGYSKLVEENKERIIANVDNLCFLKKAVYKDPEINSQVNEEIDRKEQRFVEDLLLEQYQGKQEYEVHRTSDYKTQEKVNSKIVTDLETEQISDFVFLVLKEIAENEQVKLSEIEPLGQGGYSSVYRLGDKVIKLGTRRETNSFENIPYINQPLLRREIKTKDKENELLFIEVAENLDTRDITDEEVYEVYKNIRDCGYIWTDAKRANVGRLLKDNIPHWREDIVVEDEALGLKRSQDTRVLKKGTPVLLDADFVYDENDPNLMSPLDGNYYDLEERYQQERVIENLKAAFK